MTVTSNSGPQVNFGITFTSCGVDLEHNPDRGPSYCDLGEGLIDPRPPFAFAPGEASSKPFYGWPGLFGGPVVDQAPSAKSTNLIAAAQLPVSGTALTLNSVTSNGFGAATTINAYEGGTVSIRAIDTPMTGLAFGISGGPNLWNPTTAIARTLTVYLTSTTDAGSYTIAGRDIYGMKMTESITVGGNTSFAGQKAWKYISAIQPSTTVGSTGVIIGTNDVWGFPLRVDHPGYVTAWQGPSSQALQIVVSSGYHTLAVTSAASNTTGDVRGTIASTVSSTTANFKMVMFISPSAQNLQGVSVNASGSGYPSGIVGLQQFSSV